MSSSRYPLRHATLAVAAGVALTLIPFFLPISLQKIGDFFYWPMLLVDRPSITLLPLNAGKRMFALFFSNVVVWAAVLVIFWSAGKTVMRKRTY